MNFFFLMEILLLKKKKKNFEVYIKYFESLRLK